MWPKEVKRLTRAEKKVIVERCQYLIKNYKYTMVRACRENGIAYSTYCSWRDMLSAPENKPITRVIGNKRTRSKLSTGLIHI
jgi:hypothetical protein